MVAVRSSAALGPAPPPAPCPLNTPHSQYSKTTPPALASEQSHKASLQRKLAERQADVAAQAGELAGVEAENEVLRARVAAQTVHPQDVMRMNADK
jgi:hypothetical protein